MDIKLNQEMQCSMMIIEYFIKCVKISKVDEEFLDF